MLQDRPVGTGTKINRVSTGTGDPRLVQKMITGDTCQNYSILYKYYTMSMAIYALT